MIKIQFYVDYDGEESSSGSPVLIGYGVSHVSDDVLYPEEWERIMEDLRDFEYEWKVDEWYEVEVIRVTEVYAPMAPNEEWYDFKNPVIITFTTSKHLEHFGLEVFALPEGTGSICKTECPECKTDICDFNNNETMIGVTDTVSCDIGGGHYYDEWQEVHKCPSCETVFRVSNST